jgi:hypothetical protein
MLTKSETDDIIPDVTTVCFTKILVFQFCFNYVSQFYEKIDQHMTHVIADVTPVDTGDSKNKFSGPQFSGRPWSWSPTPAHDDWPATRGIPNPPYRHTMI